MNISLGEGVKVDLDKLIESRLLVQANSGGGKSWAIRRIIEQSFGKKQIIVLDPEGEFGNMREKFDFVYAGKGGDAPVESRSAALLAHRLLELKASAIIDLYELHPQERKHFVRLFCEAMVNAPKELWHDVLVVIDEAHIFAPEKGESEAMGAVIDLATRGRKRGYCTVLATQRLPKLNKDAAAECNNKLIGRASQDIDRKRAAEELGFSTREQILSLRDLEPGEFYVFGPAISRDVVKVTIGEVKVKPAKRGVSRGTVPAPSATVKKMLGRLSDLPQEAVQEARTSAELKTALSSARAEIARLSKQGTPGKPTEADIQEALKPHLVALGTERNAWTLAIEQWMNWGTDMQNYLAQLSNELSVISKQKMPAAKPGATYTGKIPDPVKPAPMPGRNGTHETPIRVPREIVEVKAIKDIQPGLVTSDQVVSKGELVVLKALGSYPDGVSREHLTVLTGYKRSTRDRYLQHLQQKDMVRLGHDGYALITAIGIEALGKDYEPLPTGEELIEYYMKKLPVGESKILRILIDAGGEVSREALTEETGYQRSTRDRYIQYLQVRKLVETVGAGLVRVSPFLQS